MSQVLLGGGLPEGEQYLPDEEMDDEFDEFNDETFGAGRDDNQQSIHDWEIEQLAEQTAALEASTRPMVESGGDQMWMQAMLEASVSHLLEDDEDDFTSRPLPNDAHGPPAGVLPIPSLFSIERQPTDPANRLKQLYDPNLPQNRLFDVSAADAVWGPTVGNIVNKSLDSTDDSIHSQSTQSSHSDHQIQQTINTGQHQQPLMSLLAQLQSKERENTETGGEIKGAMTAEELEKHLLNNSGPDRTSPPPNSGVALLEQLTKGAAPPPAIPMPPRPMTLEELERMMKNQSPPTQLIHQPPPGLPPRVPIPRMGPPPLGHPWPPGHPGMPMPPHPPPPFPPPSPALRAAIIAHLASGRPLPPGITPQMLMKMPFMMPRPPGPGLQRFRGPMPPPGSMPPGSDPMQMRRQQHVLIRGPYDMRQMYRKYSDQPPQDPYSGLMTKREREWLIKIQMLQLQGSGNPYQDDYYWTMFRNKQYSKAKKLEGKQISPEELALLDMDHNDNATTPYVYVPPKFEGSLGKPSTVSANFPRQLIDLAAATNDHSGESSPTSSSTPTNQERPVRRLKTLLLEIEHLWTLVLECEEKTRQLMAAPDEHKKELLTELQVRIAFLCEHLGGVRLPIILSVRKGRTLFARNLPICDKDQATTLIKAVGAYLVPIAKKDSNNEMIELVFPPIFEAAKRFSKEHLCLVVGSLAQNVITQSLATKNTFASYFLLLLMCHCARKKVIAPVGGDIFTAISCWASVCSSITDVSPPDWLSSDHVDTLGQWLLSLDIERSTVASLAIVLSGS